MKMIDIVRGINQPSQPKKEIEPIGTYIPGKQCIFNISKPQTK